MGMKQEHMDLLVGCASNVRFETGQFILREGEEANSFYLLRQGKAALEIHAPGRGPISIQTLGAGEVLGWSWLVPPYRWRFDARATELTRAIALTANACARSVKKTPTRASRSCSDFPRSWWNIFKRRRRKFLISTKSFEVNYR